MKQLFFSAIMASLIVSCTTDSGVNADERREEFAQFIDEPSEITFDNAEFNFGEVTDGDMVKHTFKFTNTGDKNLILIDVKSTCGCTVPEDWPKQPIAPGEGGEIKVIFNSHNKVGSVNKGIRVEANTNPSVTTISLIGTVKAAQ